MSTTFHCPEAPSRYVRRPCSSPGLGLACREGDRCGYCDDGFEEDVETDAPSVNMSGVNASAVLSALGLLEFGDVSYGRIEHARVPDALRRILRLLNTDGAVEAHARPASEDVGAMGARSFDLGEDGDDFADRVRRLQAVLVYAADSGYSVAWD
ncbi:MAG: hypothetical protein EBT79_08700 [Actinobacteria bacterium]|nr:hypothetical protein [Actinomycetota bacterium]NBR67332.1 hypothetical protein [Actinomycetota bacterium]